MARMLYCWRCDTERPMLDDHEWEQIRRHRHEWLARAMDHRHGGLTEEATRQVEDHVLDLYRELTGFHETNISALWHHRASQFGPPCHACGKPLRTPRAKLCAACGAPRECASL